MVAGPAALPARAQAADVEAVLDRLERAGERVADLSANVKHDVFDVIIEDRQVKVGVIRYRRAEPNAQFLVQFDRLEEGGIVVEKKEWFVFDGRWLTEARELTQQVVKREIVAQGERIDPFRLGEGPFPLPFGQKKQEMLEHFEIALAPPAPGESAQTDHLRCVPRPGTKMADEYGQLDLWVDRSLDLPVKIVADQKKDNKRVTVTFTDMKLNTGVAGSTFEFKPPPGWPAPTIERLQPTP
jgi:hypothetical protein